MLERLFQRSEFSEMNGIEREIVRVNENESAVPYESKKVYAFGRLLN